AIDAEDGPLSARCLPETGRAFQLGTTQVRCRASDSAGASVEEVFEVRVQYPFRFVAKLDEERATRAKAGHAVPVAFDLDGDRGLDAVVPGGIRSLEIDCKTGEAFTEPEPAAGAEHLAYASRKDRSQFSWRTDPRWKGQCRALEVELADGSVHAARVDFGPHGRCQQHARHDPPGRGKHPHGKAHAPHHGKQHAGHAKPDVKHDGKHDRHHGGDAKHGKNGGRRGSRPPRSGSRAPESESPSPAACSFQTAATGRPSAAARSATCSRTCSSSAATWSRAPSTGASSSASVRWSSSSPRAK